MKYFLFIFIGAVWCLICGYYGLWWLLVPSVLLYQYYVPYPILVFCGLLIDIHFGQPITGFYLTGSAFVLYSVMMFTRPYLRYGE